MKLVNSVLIFFSLFIQTPLFSQITILADNETGCDSLTVSFSYTTTLPIVTSARWEFGSGLTSNTANPVLKYSFPGSYDVKLVLNNTDSVTNTDFIRIGLTPDLGIQYKDTLNPNTYTRVIKAVTTNGNSPFPYSYTWAINGVGIPDDTSAIIHAFDTTGVFSAQVIAVDAQGCTKSASANITVVSDIVVPNVFTPNNDPYNSEFKILSDGSSFISFQLFTKTGLLVYKTKAKTIVWDGKMSSGEDVSTGIYYYIVETLGVTPIVTKKGFLYIYR